MGRFQILTGIATLVAASAIVAISLRGRFDRKRSMPMQIFPMLFAAIGIFFFMSHPKRRTDH